LRSLFLLHLSDVNVVVVQADVVAFLLVNIAGIAATIEHGLQKKGKSFFLCYLFFS
jgi:hypothetical protein